MKLKCDVHKEHFHFSEWKCPRCVEDALQAEIEMLLWENRLPNPRHWNIDTVVDAFMAGEYSENTIPIAISSTKYIDCR